MLKFDLPISSVVTAIRHDLGKVAVRTALKTSSALTHRLARVAVVTAEFC